MKWEGEPDLKPLLRSIDGLKTDRRQARVHGKDSIDAIRRSLERHGQKKPIVVEASTSEVKAGNGLLCAAKVLEWTHIAVVTSKDSDIDLREYAIRDNRTAELSVWDAEKLFVELDLFDRIDMGWKSGTSPTGLGSGGEDVALDTVYQVVVTCVSEQEQEDILRELITRGLKCQALII